MKIIGVSDFVENWEFHSGQSQQCVAGTVLKHKGQLLLLDEGIVPGFYKGNARLVLQHDGADIMLQKLLPKLGGGPSPFWEAAIVEVNTMQKRGDLFVIAPKRLHYWDVHSESFVILSIDEEFVALERAKDAELVKTRDEIAEVGESDPFANAGKHAADYWADKL